MEGKERQYDGILKRFGFVLSQCRLYSEKHPSAQLAARGFLAMLESVLESEATLTLGFVGERLLVNGHLVDENNAVVAGLLREGDRSNIDSLIFEKGVDEDEIITFFKVISISPSILEANGGIKKAFEGENFQHIRLALNSYKMVKEEEEVVDKSEIGDGKGKGEDEKLEAEADITEQVRRIERMEEVIDLCLNGTQGDFNLDIDRLAYEVEKKPEAVSKLMVDKPQELESLKCVVEGVGHFLQNRLARPLIQEGKDFSQPVSRLAKEFNKVVVSPEVVEKFSGSVEELVGVLDRCADAIKLDLICRTYQESGGDLQSLTKMVTKLLRGKEARERLWGPLRERLISLGLAENYLAQVFAAVGKRRPAKKSRAVEVSAEELEELHRIRDHFEEGLSLRVEEATALIKKEKQQLKGDKERVDAIIRNLGEGLVVVDVDGKIQVMNPAAEKLLGIEQGKSRGVPLPDALKEEHLMALAKGPLHQESDRITEQIELKSLNDETRRVLQASTAIIEHEDGSTVGMVSVLSDITHEKQLHEAKAKFVSYVSHELRTPLVAIGESLSILLNEEAEGISPSQQRFLSIAHRNIGRLFRLVNDLLDISKLEAGKLDLSPVTVQIKEMVHHVVETIGSWANDRRITIEERYLEPDKDMVLEGDADRLTQVMTNLMGNAIQYSPENGKILIEVNPNWVDKEISMEPCVAISVKDSGAGIPKEDIHRIFEKFEQSNSPSHDGVKSTGLGLTIAKEIVALHGGKIWVESKVGEGSRFTFAIPRRLKVKKEQNKEIKHTLKFPDNL